MASSSSGAASGTRHLFNEQETPPARYLVAFSDGGARGNPGPSGYGVVIQNETGKKVAALSEYLGHRTNNFAEYQGLIAALEYAVANGHKALKVISDSELLVRQIKGIYKVKNAALQELHGRAKELIAQLGWFSIGHVLRGHNEEADRLANAAMDKGMGRVARTPSPATSLGNISEARQEFNGIVREGKIELLDGQLPNGTQVQVRVKK
jgi:ribonuclease HI